jgi:hypothetical protein
VILTVNAFTLLGLWAMLALSCLAAARAISKSTKDGIPPPAGPPMGKGTDRSPYLPFLAAALVILGAKLYLIHAYGSDMPFWDQWDAEPPLYIGYDQGKLFWSDLFASHNEHRVFFARIWALGLFALNGQWDPGLQTTANALLHTLVGLGLAWILWRLNGRRGLWLILGVFVLALAPPFGWENTLWGFQSSFYFLLGFSSLAILLLSQNRVFSAGWTLGGLFALLALFTMGSGFLAAFVVMGLIAVRCWREGRISASDGVTLLVCLLICLTGLWLMNVPPDHLALRPETLAHFLTALGRDLSWPWIDIPWVFPLVWAPFAILCYREVFQRNAPVSNYAFFLMGLGLWTLLQCLGLAYGRGMAGAGPASRYMDSLSMIPVVNLLAAQTLIRGAAAPLKRRKTFLAACALWCALVVIGFLNLLLHGTVAGFTHAGAYLSRQSATVRQYLADGDDKVILMARHMDIPYPDARKFLSMLKDPANRELLPASLRQPLAVVPTGRMKNDFIQKGYYDTLPVLVATRVWGSYDPVKEDALEGAMRSEILPPPRLPYLRLRIAGYLDNARLKLELYDMEGRLIRAVIPKRLPGERWVEMEVPSPRMPFYLQATDRKAGPGGWFAFSEPVEVGRFTLAAESLRSSGRSLLVIGLALTIVLVVYAHLRRAAEPPLLG